MDALVAALASAMTAGVQPEPDEANALAERHRASIAQHCDARGVDPATATWE